MSCHSTFYFTCEPTETQVAHSLPSSYKLLTVHFNWRVEGLKDYIKVLSAISSFYHLELAAGASMT